MVLCVSMNSACSGLWMQGGMLVHARRGLRPVIDRQTARYINRKRGQYTRDLCCLTLSQASARLMQESRRDTCAMKSHSKPQIIKAIIVGRWTKSDKRRIFGIHREDPQGQPTRLLRLFSEFAWVGRLSS